MAQRRILTENDTHLEALLAGVDRGLEAHVGWNQKLLRCALLRETPGKDMLGENPHLHCTFGAWLGSVQGALAAYDPEHTQRLSDAHRAMHGAVRSLCLRAMEGLPANPADLALFETQQTLMMRCIHGLRLSLTEASLQHDVLTGLPLRHGLEHAFNLRSHDAARNGQQLWVAMVDLDHFKSVNDIHGHPVGDQALKHAANVMSSTLRANDTLIRFGGEEFLSLVLVTDASEAEALSNRLLGELRSKPLGTVTGQSLRLTATLGLTQVRSGEGLTDAIARADHALLQGKLLGRDRVVVAD